jgi:nicotinamide phosphoribosyltransferase
MELFAPNVTDGYKLGHGTQYDNKTTEVDSNFTPRNFSYARKASGFFDERMVYFGLQYALIEYLIKQWNNTFFHKSKKSVIERYTRRVNNYLGAGKSEIGIAQMSALHDLGYLPLEIKSLPEGSRVNAGIPLFTVKNTHGDFYWLTNYVETILSVTVWPMCNAASLSEQYHKVSAHYGKLTGASAEYWLPFANHNFSMRGMRGLEDAIISAAAHLIFSRGTDTLPAIDFLEDYYCADSDKELIGCSVNASEHATVTQLIALLGSEEAALTHYITNIYPTGIASYVSDSVDYWNVVDVILPKLKPIIMSRQPDHNGMPACLTIRPDSSPKTPLEIIVGDVNVANYSEFSDFDHALEGMKDRLVNEVQGETEHGERGSETNTGYMKWGDKIYRVTVSIEWNRYDKQYYYVDGSDIISHEEVELTAEQKGTLQCLWDTFGGEMVTGSNGKQYRAIDGHVKIIYGEAISLEMQVKIYNRMEELGWSVSNVLFGVGSWAFLFNSSRDSYGIAMKATNSVVDGTQIEMSKSPKTSSFKKSAKGRLRVEFEDGKFVLYDQQTVEQEKQGLLEVVFRNSKMVKLATLSSVRKLAGG